MSRKFRSRSMVWNDDDQTFYTLITRNSRLFFLFFRNLPSSDAHERLNCLLSMHIFEYLVKEQCICIQTCLAIMIMYITIFYSHCWVYIIHIESKKQYSNEYRKWGFFSYYWLYYLISCYCYTDLWYCIKNYSYTEATDEISLFWK